jgi:hypothetical protein
LVLKINVLWDVAQYSAKRGSTFYSRSLPPSTEEKATVSPETSVLFYQVTQLQLRDNSNNLSDRNKGNGKAIPLQALTGPEGSRRLRLPDFKTFGT